MEYEQEIKETARVIISFTDSYTQNKQGKQNKQQESESTLSLAQVTSRLESLWRQIEMNWSFKQVIKTPNLIKSLIALSRFRLGTHIGLQFDKQRIEIRNSSRLCLWNIQYKGDEQDQPELVNKRYGRVTSISFCTAGGVGEEQDAEIYDGLYCIFDFLRELHEGRTWQPSFKQLPLLARSIIEQLEDEGANEELEAQMKNIENRFNIKSWANYVKEAILNFFIHKF
ncbi:MAG: hypothetical protein EZS28_006786 [Streblomastix strix]|uniref:Uncharacterized protein n=1 Tax=Streblomastix strix TaxID=222440 RepID=A0A5J4WRZ7_9EUKA|nr:MAG: hypothetical protein EZS28_006786 [Streblomastix strix]